MGTDNLATELLHEVKAQAKRWFIAFCIMVGLEIFTIVGFIWYISLPIDESEITQTIDDLQDSNAVQRIGDNYGENDTVSEENTQGNTQ